MAADHGIPEIAVGVHLLHDPPVVVTDAMRGRNEAHVRSALVDTKDGFQVARIPIVIRVEEEDNICLRLNVSDIEARKLTAVRLLNQSDARVGAGHTHALDVRGTRSVVDYYDLVEWASLTQRSTYRVADESAVVVVVD